MLNYVRTILVSFESEVPVTRGKGEGSPRRRKDGRWEHAITIGATKSGNPKRVSFYGATRKEASAKAMKALAERRTGTFTPSDPTTVADLFARWLEFRTTNRKLKQTTAHSYAWIARHYLLPRLGDMRVTALTPLHLERLQASLAREGLSPRTIRYARSLLSSALKQAMRWGLIHRNVVDFVETPRVTRPKRRVWQPEEAHRFFEAARNERLHALFHLALVTGLRRGELLGLRWQDLDLEVMYHTAGTVSANGRTVRGTDTRWQQAGILSPARLGGWLA
jgi:integrase